MIDDFPGLLHTEVRVSYTTYNIHKSVAKPNYFVSRIKDKIAVGLTTEHLNGDKMHSNLFCLPRNEFVSREMNLSPAK
jgi:hypothetical protein